MLDPWTPKTTDPHKRHYRWLAEDQEARSTRICDMSGRRSITTHGRPGHEKRKGAVFLQICTNSTSEAGEGP